MSRLKETKKARIGVYTMGLKHYWGQFPGLRERMIEYGQFIADKITDIFVLIITQKYNDLENISEKALQSQQVYAIM